MAKPFRWFKFFLNIELVIFSLVKKIYIYMCFSSLIGKEKGQKYRLTIFFYLYNENVNRDVFNPKIFAV